MGLTWARRTCPSLFSRHAVNQEAAPRQEGGGGLSQDPVPLFSSDVLTAHVLRQAL